MKAQGASFLRAELKGSLMIMPDSPSDNRSIKAPEAKGIYHYALPAEFCPSVNTSGRPRVADLPRQRII